MYNNRFGSIRIVYTEIVNTAPINKHIPGL